jgi:hypothetical protein
LSSALILVAKWPVLGRHQHATAWLQVREDLGRAPRTLDAYARGRAEYLVLCEREGADPLAASRTHVGVFVRELTSRPHRRGANVVSIDSGTGLANATIQQRLVPVRLFYGFLMEEGLCESNPMGRGRYTPGRRQGGPAAGPGAEVVQAGVDPERAAVAGPSGSRAARAGTQPGNAGARLRRSPAPRGAVLAADRRPGSRAPDGAGACRDDEEPGRRRTGWNAWCPALHQPVRCRPATSSIVQRSAGPGGRRSCRNPAGTTPSR